nr:MAG TPA: hypothetical protein [Caudoviricetes sp.]
MEQTDYTCKDCFFFKEGKCCHPTEKSLLQKRILLAGISSIRK